MTAHTTSRRTKRCIEHLLFVVPQAIIYALVTPLQGRNARSDGKTIEIAVLEGLLSWDDQVLELFRGDGKQGQWRLHGSLVTDVVVERRKDRIDVRFHTAPQFDESAQMSLEQESSPQTLLAAMRRCGDAAMRR